MKKQIFKIIERVKKKNAVGIIYNIPKNDSALLNNRMLDDKLCIAVNAHDAYTAQMFNYRLGLYLKIKRFNLSMLPGLIDDKILLVNSADVIMPSFSKVLDELQRLKIPLLLLMHNEVSMDKVRKMNAYNRVLTIEYDYNSL